MKKLTKTMVTAVLALAMVFGAVSSIPAVSASAEEQTDTRIPVPEIPIVTGPVTDASSFNIDMDAIDALFPREIEVSYADGVISVKDIGAGYVNIYSGGHYNMTLVDGYWTAEVEEREEDSEFVYFYYDDPDSNVRYWNVTYLNGERDPYVSLSDRENNIFFSFNAEYGELVVQYYRDGMCIYDTYHDGALTEHRVVSHGDGYSLDVIYNPDGSVRYVALYIYGASNGGWNYYLPDQGWSDDWDKYIPADAPAGFEDKDESYFVSASPSFLCQHSEWNDATCEAPKTCSGCGLTEGEALGHSFADADCDTPKTCSVCGETEGEALGHSWNDATVEAPKTCSVCGETEGEKLDPPADPMPPMPPETPEEQGWFAKLINAILDFFRRLFGIENRR